MAVLLIYLNLMAALLIALNKSLVIVLTIAK